MQLFTYLKQQFSTEKDSWILWFPVFFGIGIAIYFSLPFEPLVRYSLCAFIAAVIGCFAARKFKPLFWCMVIAATMTAGFLCSNIRTSAVKAPIIANEKGVKKITGVIRDIQSVPRGQRYIVGSLQIEGLEAGETPKKLRMNVNTEDGGAVIGDTISMLAALSPPPKPVIAGGYDFARYIFFEGIGAVGYSVAKIEVVKHSEKTSIHDDIAKLRRVIVGRVLSHMDKVSGNIAIALMVGEQGGIDKQTLNDVRISGIAHILSISGMHLSLVAALFFFSSRAIFAMIPRFALRYNIKKWAAYIAIAGSLFYLLISGAPVPAQRAFIMTALILVAVIIDRNGTPMRSIALAAMMIMLFNPESVLSPSFQMSFAAVVALISGFEALKPIFSEYARFGIGRKIMMYVIGLALSSLIAGTATAPFAMYHFNNFSSYGIITNLIAVPLSSFIIMPGGVVALLLMPFGLEVVGLVPMQWGIKMMVAVATYIANLPQAVSGLPQLPLITFLLVILGGLWLCLWQKQWRRLGLIPIVLGCIMIIFATKPDLIISESGKLFAVRGEDGQMLFSSNKAERYTLDTWKKEFAIEDTQLIEKAENADIKCDEYGCIFNKNGKKLVISKHFLSLQEDCQSADMLINLTHFHQPCDNPKTYINLYDLKQNGTHTIHIGSDIEVNSVGEGRAGRPWGR